MAARSSSRRRTFEQVLREIDQAKRSTRVAEERQALMELMTSSEHRVPNRRVDENIVIGTWNIKHFGSRHSGRAIQYIADIVERFDLIAIQEVKKDLLGLQVLQGLLPGNYKILVSDLTGNHERFAFLYDKRTVAMTGLVCEVGFPPNGSRRNSFQFDRMPYCVSFRAGRFDFVVASVHLFFGRSTQQSIRRKEVTAIVDYVEKQRRDQRSFDRDYFVLGDFNIPDAGTVFFRELVRQGFRMPAGMNDLGTNYKGTKTYDKIAWVPRPSFAFSGAFGALPFGDVLFRNGSGDAERMISDHRPLWAEFQVNKLSQQLDQVLNRN